MIYEFPDAGAPIRQGDIFAGLPRVDLSLKRMPLLTDDDQKIDATWDEVADKGEEITAILGVESVMAIVANQDCDTQRSEDLTLCQIRKFSEVYKDCPKDGKHKDWMKVITKQSRANLKWFYLPPDNRIGFSERMAIDFLATIRVPREDLEDLRSRRKGRLNFEADEHFREKISDFFRRYPYDEWYPLTTDEVKTYKDEHGEVEVRPWQAPPAQAPPPG